jgi:hypothetical protein
MEEWPNEYALIYLQLRSFFEDKYGAINVAEIATNYSSIDYHTQKAVPTLYSKQYKNRSTRIEKKLSLALNTPEWPTNNLYKHRNKQ